MFNNSYQKPLLFAIGFHVVLFIFLFIHFANKNTQPALQESTNIIKAVTISQSQLKTLLQPAQVSPQPPVQQEKPQQQEEQQIKEQQIKKQQVKEEQQQEKTKQLKIKQQQEIQRKKLIAQTIQQQLTTQTDQITKKQEAKAKQKQIQAAKLAAQQMLQQEVTATNDAQETAANQGEIDKYKALIIQAISQQWIVPSGAQEDEVATLTVRLAPGGVVLSVSIAQSSGDPALDRSAKVAVLNASPLPVPGDAALFDRFRVINLTVKPQGISA